MWIVCQADDSHVMSSITFLWKIWKTCFENVVCQLWLTLKGLELRKQLQIRDNSYDIAIMVK